MDERVRPGPSLSPPSQRLPPGHAQTVDPPTEVKASTRPRLQRSSLRPSRNSSPARKSPAESPLSDSFSASLRPDASRNSTGRAGRRARRVSPSPERAHARRSRRGTHGGLARRWLRRCGRREDQCREEDRRRLSVHVRLRGRCPEARSAAGPPGLEAAPLISRLSPMKSEGTPCATCKISAIYEFDDVRVDPSAFRVTKAGRSVSLEPKAFEVLLFLVENPGRLVEKRELLERVWPNTVVTESAMTRVIADLRRALGDAAREARYVETVPTKGYRFIAEVRRVPRARPPRRRPPPRGFPWPRGSPRGSRRSASSAFSRPRVASAFRRGPPRPRPRLTQLTESLGLDMFPTFSPDEAAIAYSSDRGAPSRSSSGRSPWAAGRSTSRPTDATTFSRRGPPTAARSRTHRVRSRASGSSPRSAARRAA